MLSSTPGFRESVAEMIVAMTLASARGLISRAHLIDFKAAAGHIRLAIDIFPDEPLSIAHRLKSCPMSFGHRTVRRLLARAGN